MATDTTNPTRPRSQAGAIAATPIVGAEIAKADQLGRVRWDAAFALYREANSHFDEAIDRHAEAEGLAGAACPRVDVFFDKYRLGMGMNRSRVVENLQYYNVRNDRANRIDVEAVADDFMAFQERSKAAEQRFCVGELEEAIEASRPAFHETREALMRVSAPDTAALLVKIEIAFCSLDTDHADSTLVDAKRLLAA